MSVDAETFQALYDIRGEDLLAQIELRRAAEARSRRLLLAWRNARQRAAAFNDALIDAQQERDALRAELANLQRAYIEVCSAMRSEVP